MFQAPHPEPVEESSSFLLLDSKQDLDIEPSGKVAWSGWIFLCPTASPAEVQTAENMPTVYRSPGSSRPVGVPPGHSKAH